MSYDEQYRTVKAVFGTEPEGMLKTYCRAMDAADPVLDIGAGQGRNSLFLAREGFTVHAIDPSAVAVRTVSEVAAREDLHVKAFQSDFTSFVPPVGVYSGILVFGLIQILSRKEIEALRRKIGEWTAEGALVFMTGFTIGDASFARYSRDWKPAGRNAFTDGQGGFRTFMAPGELIELFEGWPVMHHWEGMGPEHRHGDGPLQRHGMVEAVLRKPSR